jgi:hypothetical protein
MTTDEERETSQQIISILFEEEFIGGASIDDDEEVLQLVKESVDRDLFTSLIDESFSTNEQDNIFYNIGYLHAVNLTEPGELEEWGEVINNLGEFLPCEGLRAGYLDGLEYEIAEGVEDGNKIRGAASVVLRALCTKFCLDNIRSLLKPSNG